MSTVNEIIKEFGGPKVWDFNKATNFYLCKICSVTCERRFLLRHTARIFENSVKKRFLEVIAHFRKQAIFSNF